VETEKAVRAKRVGQIVADKKWNTGLNAWNQCRKEEGRASPTKASSPLSGSSQKVTGSRDVRGREVPKQTGYSWGRRPAGQEGRFLNAAKKDKTAVISFRNVFVTEETHVAVHSTSIRKKGGGGPAE